VHSYQDLINTTMTNHGSQQNSDSLVRPKKMPTKVGTDQAKKILTKKIRVA